MATNILYTLTFTSDYDAGPTTVPSGTKINVYYDDSNGIGVSLVSNVGVEYGPYYYPDYQQVLPDEGGGPPHSILFYFPYMELGQGLTPGHFTSTSYPITSILNVTDYSYNFCDNGDRITFTIFTESTGLNVGDLRIPSLGTVVKLKSPYAKLVRTPNHFSCAVDAGGDPIVCDVAFNSNQTIVYPSEGNFDGSILLGASSSNGTIKYFLNRDFDYSTEGQFTAYFSGLGQGIYNIFAKDSVGCSTTKTIDLLNSSSYGVKYYFQFKRGNYKEREGWSGKVEILQRGYSGSSTLLQMGDEAFSLDDHGENNDKFYPLVSKVGTIRLAATTYGQYSEFFTDDEFKYQIKYYKDNGNSGSSYSLDWIGYIAPTAYEDTNQLLPSIISIKCTDAIGYLKDITLTDNSESLIDYNISHMKLVSIILNKIGNVLPIRCAASKYEESMDKTSSDDPLDQTYVDGDAYTTDGDTLSCHEVLSQILYCQGCRMYQTKGAWWIVPIVDQSEEFSYREFTKDGVYSSNSTYDGNKNIDLESATDRLFWITGSATREILPGYGKITINNDLGLKTNTIIRNGSFENPVFFFSGWTFNLIQGGGVNYGYESVANGDSSGALFIEFTDTADTSTVIVQTSFDLSANSSDIIKLKFEYLMKPFKNLPYVKMQWSFKSGIYYLKDDGTWSALSADEWNTVYETSYNEFVKKDIASKPGFLGVTGTAILRFKIYGQPSHDTANLTTLRAVSTSGLPEGYKIRCADTPSGTTVVRYYELETEPGAEDSPNLIDPDDSATKKWSLKNTYAYNSRQNQLKTFLLDNVRVEYYPEGKEPDDVIVYSSLISKKVKDESTTEIIHGDLPQGQFPLSTFLNGKNLFFNYLRLSDGTPSVRWKRTQKPTYRPILDLVKEDYISQYPFGLERFTGTLAGAIDLTYGDTINYDNKKYMLISLISNETEGTYNVQMVQNVFGAGGVSVPQIGPFHKDMFSEAFNIG